MKLHPLLVCAGCALPFEFPVPGRTQTPPPPMASEKVELSPFEVKADPNDSYQAVSTTGVTGTDREIRTLPITMEAFTRTFIDDVAATDLAGLMSFATNIQDMDDSDRGGGGSTEGIRIRGLRAQQERRRDGFLQLSRYDTYNLERVEILRGPQALLYGQGVSGGAINAVTKRAQPTRNFREARFQTDNYGTARFTFDANQGTGQRLGVRVNGLWDHDRFWEDNLSTKSKAVTTNIAYRLRPKVTVRGAYEYLEEDTITRSAAEFTLLDDRSLDSRTGAKLGTLIGSKNAGGIVVGGKALSFQNYKSILGESLGDHRRDTSATLSVETQPFPHFDLRVAYNSARSLNQKSVNSNVRQLLAPTDSRAVGGTYSTFLSPSRTINELDSDSAQAAGVYQFEWREIVRNQLVVGGEKRKKTQINTAGQRLFQVDAQGKFLPGPTAGKIALPQYAVAVQDSFPGNFMSPGYAWGDMASAVPRKEQQTSYYANWLGTWFGGQVESMAGARRDAVLVRNIVSPAVQTTITDAANTTGLVGAVVNVKPWLGLYANYATSFNAIAALRANPANEFLPPRNGRGWELGVKFDLWQDRVSGSLAYYRNEEGGENVQIDNTARNAIDPAGINGRNGDIFVAVPMATNGIEATISARPVKNWRVQFSLGTTDGHNRDTVSWPIYYNDQFRTVTLADGAVAAGQLQANGTTTPLMVPSIRNQTTSAPVPLTIAMLKQPSTAANYGATLDPISGQITNAAAIRLNTAGVGTGVTGVPIAQHQLGFVAPNNGIYPLFVNGEKTTGYAETSFNLNTNYEFDGTLKGFSVGGSARFLRDIRLGYQAINGVRRLFYRPNTRNVGLRIAYRRKFRWLHWSTQLNVNNVFSDRILYTTPTATGAINEYVAIGGGVSATWINTIRF